ncbi:CDK5 regulatory subunit associated protein 2 [Phyllostomus discolor]|uniref:CDK5 regulatory subunit-associated protein 2 n=1 Tax=Phyllostomus discolor TaxID=89673 RepID=A0A834B3N8_9CHIR|nr:CDK5 regulatory subunit associated protein 2 [Phyllostomus discolor]
MDSVLEEDVTLPGTLSGCSGLVPKLPDDLEGISPIAGLGNGVLPKVSEETVSPTRARNMKDFENQITELKKENFNLKLRIYFLEERMQQEFDGPTEHIYKTNIELKVEVESLKRELQEREQLLVKASKAVESLAEGGGSEVRRVKEDAQKKVKQVEDLLTKRILLLEEEVQAAQAELRKAFAGTETERALRLGLENRLSEMKKMHEGNVDVAVALEEKDRLIEELKLSLKSKEALIQCLKEERSQMVSPGEDVSSAELRGLPAALREEKGRETEALQEDLREKEREIATEKKNSLKRDKAIQGLAMALKSKEKEVEELNSEIQELNAALAKAQEARQETHTQKFQGSADYEAALSEKAALLAVLHSENLTKSAENHRLRRNMKKVTQELSDLQQEKERLEKDVQAARREKSRGDSTIHDLKNEVEKLRNEVNEREKAVENCYKCLLSESNKKLHSQEQMIKHLAESIDQKDKDLLLQKFNEKESEATQENRYLTTVEDLKFGSEDFTTEECSPRRSPGGKSIFSEEKQQLDYEELIQVLKKEQDIYAHLVKSLQDSDSAQNLQAELNSVWALRQQLERDVLAYRNLKKALEEQISEIRRREEEPFSFYSDQTSYLSICLEERSPFQVEHFSQEELKKKVSDLVQLVKELYTDNQHLKKTIFDLSCLGFQGDGRLESTEQTELPASKEDKDTIRIGEDGENNFLSGQNSEQSHKIIEDGSKEGCKNGYLRHTDSSILNCGGAHRPGRPGDPSAEEGELVSLLAPLLNEKAASLLEARPGLLKELCELLLGRGCLPEQAVSGEHPDGKTEKTLKQMAVQLRGELGQFLQASLFPQPHGDLKSPWGAPLVKAAELARVELRDASVQTTATEGDVLGFRHEGRSGAWEETPTDAAFSTEHPPDNLGGMPGRQAAPPSFFQGTDREAKKSRLPILMKPSQSLGSVCPLPDPQEVVAQLRGQILELQGELKEFKMRNKQLHQKLILAEAMTEESPVPDKTLLKDPEIDQLSGLAVSPTGKEDPSEDVWGPTSVAPYLSSKGQLSPKVSAIATDQSENIGTSDDTENLKQKIGDLETELEGYRNFLFQLQKHSRCSEAIITVLCGTEGAQDGSSKPRDGTDEEEMTFSSLHQVRYVKHMKILCPPAPEMIDSGLLGSLEQQRGERDCELQKEQDLNMELFSEIHNLQNKFRDLSPSRYNSLVQSQARELSLQRQQIKDSRDICVICRQHASTMIKAFEELLQASDVDRYVAAGFREQLNQCAALLGRLERLFLGGKSGGVETGAQNELMERVEEDSLTDQHILPESPEPSASHALSDGDTSDKSSCSRDQKQDSETEKTSVTANNFSQDLLMEHIQEIRSLRKRLEESIKTNEKLRRQLERQGSELDQGSSNTFVCGSELHNSLTSEIRFLRKQNQALNAVLAKGSRDKQKENEKLRESLSRKAADLEHLQRELACLQAEHGRLQQEAGQRQRHSQQLLQELCDSRSELSRVQEEVKWRQQLLSQNDKVLQSLRVELKVYEKLDEEHRIPRESRAEASGEAWKGQDPLGDLRDLLTEVRALRTQLERGIETNSMLQARLQEQLAKGGGQAPDAALALALQTLPSPSPSPEPLQPDGQASETPPLSKNDGDSLSCDSGSTTTSALCVSRLVPGHQLWASKSGCHVLGLIEDYDALCEHIGRGQKLLAEMDIQIQEAPSPSSREQGTKGLHLAPLSRFVSGVSRTKLVLDEAERLLTLLWRVSLPTGGQCTLHCEQIGEMKAEITRLHKKLFEQEKKLQNTMKLLQLSKHQEKVIFDQLVITHKILRKARGNLELRPGGAHPGAASPSRPGS